MQERFLRRAAMGGVLYVIKCNAVINTLLLDAIERRRLLQRTGGNKHFVLLEARVADHAHHRGAVERLSTRRFVGYVRGFADYPQAMSVKDPAGWARDFEADPRRKPGAGLGQSRSSRTVLPAGTFRFFQKVVIEQKTEPCSAIFQSYFRTLVRLVRLRPFDMTSVEGRSNERHRLIVLSSLTSAMSKVMTAGTTLHHNPI